MSDLTQLLDRWSRLQPSFCKLQPGVGYQVADGRNSYYITPEASSFTLAVLQGIVQTAIAVNLELSATLARVSPVISDDSWVAMISHVRIRELTVCAAAEHPAIALLDAHVQLLEAMVSDRVQLATAEHAA